MKYRLVEKMVGEEIPVNICCETLQVSRSGYYAWQTRPESIRAQKNDVLLSQVTQIHYDSRETYGLPRILATLRDIGERCGKARVSSVMKSAGISGLIKRRYKVCTTDSNHENPIAARIFKTEEVTTHPDGPNQVWVGDISYITTDEGFLFLATIMDLYTRKIVGFSMAEHMRTELILTALDMALRRQNLTKGELVYHSDRGSQYASEEYRKKLEELGISASMSRKGNCWDNAYAESFFATLKKELVYREKYKTRDEAKKSIFEFIEVWYNRVRIHSSIGYQTPVQYEQSMVG